MLTLTPGSQVRLAGARWIEPSAVPSQLGQAESGTEQLESAVDDIAQTFLALSDRLETDADLALNPDRFQEIEIIGGLDQVRIFETIAGVAGNISDLILGVLQPPLGPYATPATTEVLSEVDTRMKAVKQAMTDARGDTALTTVVLPEAQAYQEAYLNDISDIIIAVEKLVVMEENGNVPVYEPDEKGPSLAAVAGLAVAVTLMVVVLA